MEDDCPTVQALRSATKSTFTSTPHLSPPSPSLHRLPPGLHHKETNPPLRRHPVKPLYDIPIFILIGTNLTSVLRHHHALVCEDQAFEPRIVLAALDFAKTQVHAQLAEKKCQGEERDLPPSVEHPPVNDNFPTYPVCYFPTSLYLFCLVRPVFSVNYLFSV
ncbi:hypothetical protein BKA57DRAFT_496863 [Linnemannia elongata]|nr:hypothetical protein BKA57DRAFT_496863 [Linnemannia elongata]